MINSNQRKAELLGEPFGTANNKLRKIVLYELAKQLSLLDCYRCGKFMVIKDFSIDHKERWGVADDPIKVFYDIENIAFSHGVCNTVAGNIESKGVYSSSIEKSRHANKVRYADPVKYQQHLEYKRKWYGKNK